MGSNQRKRQNLFKRDKYKCCRCGTSENLTVDHIIPKALGGRNIKVNKQTLCGSCNEWKGKTIQIFTKDKSVIQYVMAQLRKNKFKF